MTQARPRPASGMARALSSRAVSGSPMRWSCWVERTKARSCLTACWDFATTWDCSPKNTMSARTGWWAISPRLSRTLRSSIQRTTWRGPASRWSSGLEGRVRGRSRGGPPLGGRVGTAAGHLNLRVVLGLRQVLGVNGGIGLILEECNGLFKAALFDRPLSVVAPLDAIGYFAFRFRFHVDLAKEDFPSPSGPRRAGAYAVGRLRLNYAAVPRTSVSR